MKRFRDSASGSDADSGSEGADETSGDRIAPSTEEPPVSREHHNATLGPTLRSAGLGKASKCFLCAYTDEKLAEGSIFSDTHGPIERVTRLWQAHADTMDADLLAADCHKLLLQLVSAYAPPPLTEPASAAIGDTHGSGGVGAFEEVTPGDVKRHFTVCMVTDGARLTAMKASFRHLVQLEVACAQGALGASSPTPRVRGALSPGQRLTRPARRRICRDVQRVRQNGAPPTRPGDVGPASQGERGNAENEPADLRIRGEACVSAADAKRA